MFRIATILMAACAFAQPLQGQGRPATATPAIRAGTYDLQITFGGGVLEGTLILGWVRDSVTATLMVGEHESPVHPARQDGSLLVLEGAPGLAIRYQLSFTADSVTGTFTYDGSDGTVAGRRRPPTGP